MNGGTLDLDEVPVAWRMPTSQFRARQSLFAVTPAERAAVAARPRFYSLPWLKRAEENEDDCIP